MTTSVDRTATWEAADGVVTVYPAGTRWFVQLRTDGHVRPTCDRHGYHRPRAAIRAARRAHPAVS